MKKIFTLFLSFILIGAAQAQVRYFYGLLSGANEVPPNGSTATGVVIAKFNTSSKLIEVYGNYNGLSLNVTASHIHPGAAGANGGVLIPLTTTGGTSGNLTGSGTLDLIGETNLFAAGLYVNVHTVTYPGGEIRTQLNPIPDGDAVFLNARLQGAQENLPTNSAASGTAHILMQKSTRVVYLTGNYANLTTAINNAHIHVSRAGFNGAVILGLTYSGGTSGTLHGSGPLSVELADSLANNRTYVNVHSTTFPGGEIRGQVTNYSQIRFLGERLSGANEVPPNASVATGTVICRYNPETNEIELFGDFQNLVAPATASHIHGAPAGINGPVLVNLSILGANTGTLYVKSSLTDPQEVELLLGNMYVNVHNATFPGGEIRAQLMPATAGETQFAEVTLSALQEVPPNGSTGIGGAIVMVDKLTGQTYITGAYSGMSSNVTMAHLHEAAAGTNGPVILPLTHTGGTQGTISGAQILTPSQVNSFVNGLTYVNIHTENIGSGEIRGQAGDQVLPVRWGSVTGVLRKNVVELSWQVLTEENVKQYQVEQQNTQTGNWLTRATIPAKGFSPSTYKTEDIPSSFGELYVNYRIKAVDKDGKFGWSPVVRIGLTAQKDNLTIMENPVTSTLRFRLATNMVHEPAQAVIVDMQGRIFSRTIIPQGGNQSISTGSLSAGIYILQVKAGDETITRKFMKQ